ncbi:aminotransferase [Celeribacter neptunius]|uniref:aspartate transaminase n=1 Tax=Celeribacter neptunius TaxID=588602 RepID=A0A1I3M2W7_9RHOB|nr:aminotransferase [Celeribacter neptunius]SFI91046.1 Aspartate/methionine/tyrosine aminotransferase [Celeribacter neptunius]
MPDPLSLPLSPAMARTQASPIVASRGWLEGVTFSADQPLINVSQAAPMEAPPLPLRQEIARIALEDTAAHLYGPVLGLPELRAEIASQWSSAYHAEIAPREVAITSGCNQAFTAVMSTLAQAGDEIALATPWYFNHKMWCDMSGVTAVPLPTGEDLLPDLEDAARLITPRTRAIVLITPNNPGGVEYPAELLTKFYALAREHRIALVLDETYRDFDSRSEVPHYLFRQPDWHDTLIQLYSFSKAFRLTGHRVGALIAAPERLTQVEKYLDTVTICPNQIGQRAALWGLQNLSQWVAGERAEILARRQAILDGFPALAAKGWKLLGCGAFFAYVSHPFDMPSSQLAPWLVREAGVLLLPGTAFMPENDPRAEHQLRIAFANIDRAGITELFTRLARIDP